jgi:hypothetical protein
MALTYCESCGTIEGRTTEIVVWVDETYCDRAFEETITVCDECDTEEPIRHMPEHDNSDMER